MPAPARRELRSSPGGRARPSPRQPRVTSQRAGTTVGPPPPRPSCVPWRPSPRAPAVAAPLDGHGRGGWAGRVKGAGPRREGWEELTARRGPPSGASSAAPTPGWRGAESGGRGRARGRRGAGFLVLARSVGAGRERVVESTDEPGAREGTGNRRGGQAGGRRSCPPAERPRAAGGGCWRRGRPIRAGPAPVIGSGGRRGGRARLAYSAFPGEFPSGGGRGCLSLRRCRHFPPRGCCRALSRGRRRQQQRAREATT